MSSARSNNTKKVHFERNDIDDVTENGDKLLGSQGETAQLRLRHSVEGKRGSLGSNYDYNNDQVFIGKLFKISPAHTLMFPTGQEKDANSVLTLTNEHANIVAYKVKTTSPSKYRVRPGHGILLPGSKAEVVISLIEGNSVNVNSQDKFLIMGMEIKDENIDQVELSDLWRTYPRDKLMEHRLYCDQQPIAVESPTSTPPPTPTDITADTLMSQNTQLMREVRSLKKTLHLMLILQLLTVSIVVFIHCYFQWSPQTSKETSSPHSSIRLQHK